VNIVKLLILPLRIIIKDNGRKGTPLSNQRLRDNETLLSNENIKHKIIH
jgi:hypothetical protein